MNLRPLDPQSSTLPAALHPDLQRSIKPCLNRIPNPEGKVKCFVKISAANLRHAACFERRRTVTPSETAYTLREPIVNTAIIIKTTNPSAAENAPDSRISTSHRRAMYSGRLSQSASKCAARTVPGHSSESLPDETQACVSRNARAENRSAQRSQSLQTRSPCARPPPVQPEMPSHTLSRTRHNTLFSSGHLISLGTKRSPQKRTPFLI